MSNIRKNISVTLKKNNKKYSRKNRKQHTAHTRVRSQQTGGFVKNVPLNTNIFVRNSALTLLDTNPQASLDLDNKIMVSASGGSQPLIGGSSCGNKGNGIESNDKHSGTFKNYLNTLNASLDLPLRRKNKMQNAGGYSTDTSEYIAGQPVYKGYSDCCPPALLGGKLTFGDPNTPICGAGVMRGGRQNNSKKYVKQENTKKKQYGGNIPYDKNSNLADYTTSQSGTSSVFSYNSGESSEI